MKSHSGSNDCTGCGSSGVDNMAEEILFFKKSPESSYPRTAGQILASVTNCGERGTYYPLPQQMEGKKHSLNLKTQEVETADSIYVHLVQTAEYIDSVISDFKKDNRGSQEQIVRFAIMSDMLKRSTQDLQGKNFRSKLHPETVVECIDIAVSMGYKKYDRVFRSRFPLLDLTEVRKAVMAQKSTGSGNRCNVIKSHNILRDEIVALHLKSGLKSPSQVFSLYDICLMFDEKKIASALTIDHRLGKTVGIVEKSLQLSYQIDTAGYTQNYMDVNL